MTTVNDVIITDTLRAKYAEQYVHDENTIRCFEHIKNQSTERLQGIIYTNRYGARIRKAAMETFAKEFYPNTNLNWIAMEVGSELYMRDVLDEDDWVDLQDRLV